MTDSDGTGTWSDYSPAIGVSLMSAIDRGGTAGSGRLIVITDSNLWDSAYDYDFDGDINFYDSDNEILALNVIDWLSTPTIFPLGDVNKDSILDQMDLSLIGEALWTEIGDPRYNPDADLNSDGA